MKGDVHKVRYVYGHIHVLIESMYSILVGHVHKCKGF